MLVRADKITYHIKYMLTMYFSVTNTWN